LFHYAVEEVNHGVEVEQSVGRFHMPVGVGLRAQTTAKRRFEVKKKYPGKHLKQ